MNELGFPFFMKHATCSLKQQSGFKPMVLQREETRVEFDVGQPEIARIGSPPAWTTCI